MRAGLTQRRRGPRPRLTPTALVLGGLLAAGCGPSWSEVKPEALPGPADYPQADAVVLLDETRVVFRLEDGEPIADETEHRRLRVLTAEGHSAARHTVSYNADLWTVRELDARVIEPDGTEHAVPGESAVDLPAFPGYALFSDARIKRLTHPTGLGDVFEARSVVRHADVQLAPVVHHFASRHPIVQSRLVVELPAGWDVGYKAIEAGAVKEWTPTSQDLANGGRRLTWERADQAPAEFEPAAPAWTEMAPQVRVYLTRWTVGGAAVEGHKTPEDVSKRLYTLQSPQLEVTDAVRERATAILEGVGDDPRAKARALFEHVRDEVRYVSVQLGIGGWVPHPADEVDGKGHGDCKDQAALLAALLAAADIPSRLVTVHTHRGWPVPYLSPTIAGNANHEIVAIDLPDGPVYADPTRSDVPFGALPAEVQGAPALPITEAGSALLTLPESAPADNALVIDGALTVDRAGNVKGSAQIEARGEAARDLRWRLRGRQNREYRQVMADSFALRLMTVASIDGKAGVAPEDPSAALEASVDLRRRRPIGVEGTEWTVTAADLVRDMLPFFASDPRTRPVELHARRQYTHRLVLTLPEGAAIEHIPEPATVDGSLGRYTLKWAVVDGALRLERTLELRRTFVPAAEIADAHAFFDALRAADRRAVLIAPKAARTKSLAEVSR